MTRWQTAAHRIVRDAAEAHNLFRQGRHPATRNMKHETIAQYTLRIVADTGYKSTAEGFCTPHQYSMAIAALKGAPHTSQDLKSQRDELLRALKGIHMWAENQAVAQSKGGHATVDLLMLREQLDIAATAIAKAEGA